MVKYSKIEKIVFKEGRTFFFLWMEELNWQQKKLKQWSDVNDIRQLAQCSKKQAYEIKKEIVKKLEEKGYMLPSYLVPTVNVVEYLKIDLKFLEARALCEDKINKNL